MSFLGKILNSKNPVYIFVAALTIFFIPFILISRFGNFSDKLTTLFQVGASAVMLFYSKKIFNDLEFENRYFKFIFILFIGYDFILILRGFELNYQQFKFYLQNDFVFWPFIIPLAVFFNKNELNFFYLIKTFYFLAIGFLAITVIDSVLVTERSTAELFIMPYAYTCGFLFLNAKYLSKKITWVAFFSLVVGLTSFVYLARRNAIVSFGALILLGLYFILRNQKAGKLIRLFPLFLGMLTIVLYSVDLLPASFTSRISDRLTENSRSYVFENFFKAMDEDMVFGKGMNGTYYSPIDEQTTEDGVNFVEIKNRNVIENGYLQLLLNGGYVYLVLFVLTLLPAAYLGIFRSENQLTVTCGLVIFLWLLDMAVYGLPRILLQYILVWISAGICYKESFRNKSDEEISELFEAVGMA